VSPLGASCNFRIDRRYCSQYAEVVSLTKQITRSYILQEDYLKLPQHQHKEGTHALQRLIDFLDRFVQANQELIRDHEKKLRLGKKTRRVVPDQLFYRATDTMAKMLDIFKKVKV